MTADAGQPLAVRRAFFKQVGFLEHNLHHPSRHAKKYDEARDIWQARVNRDWRLYFNIIDDTCIIGDIIPHPNRDRAESAGGVGQAISEKLAELALRKAGILDNTTHRERVHRVMPWDGHDPPAVGHDDMLALPRNLKANLLKRPNSPKAGDPRYLRHKLRRDFHFPQVLPAR